MVVIVVVEIEVVVIEVAVIDVVVCVVSVPDVVVDVPLAPMADDGGCMADAKLAAKARRSRCGCRGTLVIAHPSTNQSGQNGQSMTKYDKVQVFMLKSPSTLGIIRKSPM